MIRLRNIHSLSDFQRNTKAYVGRLKKSGEPAVLTVNGEPELVVLSADAYQKMLADLEMAENLNSIHKGVRKAERGEGVPAEAAFAMLERKFAARRRRKAS